MPMPNFAATFDPATSATNQIGLALYRQLAAARPDENLLLSPYSIQLALAMAYGGADGETRAEMARVLHFPSDDAPLTASFRALRLELEAAAPKVAVTPVPVTAPPRRGRGSFRQPEPTELHVVNRLYVQDGFGFRPEFLALMQEGYDASFSAADFRQAAEPARATINNWVAEQTHQKIHDLIPPDGLNTYTRLVLVNALYLKAQWAQTFYEGATRDRPFRVRGKEAVSVPTMAGSGLLSFGYAKHDGFTAITLPYRLGYLQFLILMPDAPAGLDALIAKVTPELLRSHAQLPTVRAYFFMPKFKVETPTIPLKAMLQALGMKTAFNVPAGSANFDRIAPRQPNDYLRLTEVYHKAYLVLDEHGTEAAAATAGIGGAGGGPPKAPPEVHVDRPFLFAIQERESGLCLFLGRVTDPR